MFFVIEDHLPAYAHLVLCVLLAREVFMIDDSS